MKKCLYFIEIAIFIVGFQLVDAAETSVDSCMIGVTSNASSQVGGPLENGRRDVKRLVYICLDLWRA